MQIPDKLVSLVLKHGLGEIRRTDISKAKNAMAKLGVRPESQFSQFYSAFILSNLISPSSDEALVDVSEPTEEVSVGTKFIHEVWGIPEEYICITTCEGEGGYFYSNKTEGVYEFSLANREEFLTRKDADWNNFYEFITWYLSPNEHDSL